MKQNVKVEAAIVKMVRKAVKPKKQTIGGFFELAAAQSMNPCYNVLDNCQEFEKFLDRKGVKWKNNGHFTTVLNVPDPVGLGMEWGIHKALNDPKYKASTPSL